MNLPEKRRMEELREAAHALIKKLDDYRKGYTQSLRCQPEVEVLRSLVEPRLCQCGHKEEQHPIMDRYADAGRCLTPGCDCKSVRLVSVRSPKEPE